MNNFCRVEASPNFQSKFISLKKKSLISAPHPWIQIPSHVVKFRSRAQGHAQGIPCRAAEAPSCTHTEDALNSSSNALSSLLSACKSVGHSAVSPLKTRPQKVMENKHECVVECKKKKKEKENKVLLCGIQHATTVSVIWSLIFSYCQNSSNLSQPSSLCKKDYFICNRILRV